MKLQFLADGSPDCPLIRLYDFQAAESVRLKTLFERLANGSLGYVSLHQQPGIEPIDGCQLNLHVGKRDTGIVQTAGSFFECSLSPERWSDVAALAEPFCEAARPNSYQWLNEDGEISLLLSPDGKW
jgi:hypothetical protein